MAAADRWKTAKASAWSSAANPVSSAKASGAKPSARRGAACDMTTGDRRRPGQWPPPVETSFQFGSRELTSRAKLQASLTSTTLSALPSIDGAIQIARRIDHLGRKAKGDLGEAAAHPRVCDRGVVYGDEGGLDLFAALLALGQRRRETVVDVLGQQILQHGPVAVGEAHHDHFIGGFGAVEERLDGEGGIRRGDGVETRPDLGARLRIGSPPLGGLSGRRARGDIGIGRAGQRNDLGFGGGGPGVARPGRSGRDFAAAFPRPCACRGCCAASTPRRRPETRK